MPRLGAVPSPQKQPKTGSTYFGKNLVWRFSSADKGGPFSWIDLSGAVKYKEVMEKLHLFETMSEREIREAGSHSCEIGNLSKDARDRLSEILLDDMMSFFHFA